MSNGKPEKNTWYSPTKQSAQLPRVKLKGAGAKEIYSTADGVGAQQDGDIHDASQGTEGGIGEQGPKRRRNTTCVADSIGRR